MFGNAVDLARDQVYGNVLDLAGGRTAVNSAAFDLGAFQYDSAGRDDRVAAYFGIVHDDGAHAYEHFITKFTAMYNGVVADGDIVADDGLGFLVSGVDDDTILDVDLIADADAVDIAAYDGIEPDAGLVTDLDISDHGGIGGDKAIISQ